MNGFSSRPRVVRPNLRPETVRRGSPDDIIGPDFICLSRHRTHDIMGTDRHAYIKQVGKDINEAVQAALPEHGRIRYTRVLCLLLSWQQDNLGVETELDRLEEVFEDTYHFSVKRYKIPSLQPLQELHKCLQKFLENVEGETLRIVYYGGHAQRREFSTEPSIWFANRQDRAAQLPSAGIQALLEEANCDVLLLYDCCNSATGPACGANQRGVTEVIAACGYQDTAAEVDEHSFTNALIHILEIAAQEGSFSVGQLHSRILGRLKGWFPENVHDRQPRRTPVHCLLSETRPPRSIFLGPLPQPASLPTKGPGYRRHALHCTNGNESPNKKRKEGPAELKPQILIAIRVDETSLNKEEWVEWMKNVPTSGRDIHVEGRWDSFSTLLLLRMPVQVWDLLPENPAYTFVGFVTSRNHITTEDVSEDPRLSGQEPSHETPPADLWTRGLEGSTFVRLLRTINILHIIHWVLRAWNTTDTVTARKKLVFIGGVFNILISGYILGGLPQYFHWWYTAQLLYLLPIRYYTFRRRGFELFLADLCYVVNLLCMCTIWFFPQSTRLFIGTYCLAFGNNAISITVWQSFLIFQNLDKVTTVFIHVMPCVALHCLVHLLPPDLQQERFPAIWAIRKLAPTLRIQDSLLAMTVWSTVPYFIWQISYYFIITCRQRQQIADGKLTSFTWLRKRYAQAPIGRAMLLLPISMQEPAFMMLQYIFVALTTLPCLIWFWNQYASAAFLIIIFSGSVYNGATFYIDVFDKRQKAEEESVGKDRRVPIGW